MSSPVHGLNRSYAYRRNTLAVLFVAGLMSILFAAPTVLADDPDQPAHTHYTGQLPPPETDGTAFIQWGGGSLYQLTARLAVNGCDLNRFWVYDDQTRKYTAPYTFDGPSFLNARFNRLYEDNIPPTTLWVKCIDMLQHVYGYGLLPDAEKQEVDALKKGIAYVDWLADRGLASTIEELRAQSITACGDHWNDVVREHFLPYVPIPQQVCITYQRGGGGHYNHALARYPSVEHAAIYYAYSPHVIVHSQETDINTLHSDPAMLAIEFHELCHANQFWNQNKHLLTYDFLEKLAEEGEFGTPNDYASYSGYFSDFVTLVKFEQHEDATWRLPTHSTFEEGEIYGTHTPLELSAELCSGYLLTKALVNQRYTDYFEPYLTAEVIAWLEKYVFVLPEAHIDFDALRINVSLVDANGQPVSGAEVLICPPELGGCGTARTDENGLASKRLGLRQFVVLISVPDAEGSEGGLSYYSADASGHLTADRDAATVIHFSEEMPDLKMALPATS